MGWRDVFSQVVWSWTGCSDDRAEATGMAIVDAILDMPLADRIALARELLEGTGWTGVFKATPRTEDDIV